jgi:hypothetical protein
MKLEMQKGILQQILMKSRGSLGNILKLIFQLIEKSNWNGSISGHM